VRTQYLNHFPEDWLPATRVFSALGDTTRQQILLLFEPGELLSIKDISSLFSLGRSTIVHHLTVLEAAGILAAKRQGRQTLYSIVYPAILASLERLRLFIESDLQTLSDCMTL
jgi:DNA-binding transcriptional ArsR family regulator